MGLYGKSDGLVTGGVRAVMSIGFAFFKRRHYTHIHERSGTTMGGEVPESSWEAAGTFVLFLDCTRSRSVSQMKFVNVDV